MNKLLIGLSFLTLLCATSCTQEEITVKPTEPSQEIKDNECAGQIIVRFSPEVGEILDQMSATRSETPATRSGIASVDDVMQIIGAYELERVFPIDPRHEERTREAGMHLWYVVRFDDAHSVEEVTRQFTALGEVQKATPVRTIHRAYRTDKKAIPAPASLVNRPATRANDYPFNDVLLDQQWHLINRGGDLFTEAEEPKDRPENGKWIAGADVQCEKAWEMTTGDPSIIVAVLDEGVCLTHPELKDCIWVNEDEVDENGNASSYSQKDYDGNGYKGDVHGYNFVKETGVITWDGIYDTGHGTHVAGVIAAMNNNSEGISSIAGGTPDAPGVKIMSCQVFSGQYATNTVQLAKAIKYAADNGAVILQCSWGYTSGDANHFDWGYDGFKTEEDWEYNCPLEKNALDYFVHMAGSPNGTIDGGLAIFASGNESAASAGYPGAAKMCIAVGATAADFTPSVFTNYGTGTKISAPGGDQDYYYEYYDATHERGEVGCILSTLPYHVSETGYGYMEGTSMACPHASGVAALGLSYAAKLRRHFTVEEFTKLFCEQTTSFDDYLYGPKYYYKYMSELGLVQYQSIMMDHYRGKMGGQVNAYKLLKAIEGSGTQLEFPNIYVAPNKTVTTYPANYFVGGDQLTYQITIADGSIATAEISAKKPYALKVTGVKAGSTKATIKASDGKSFTFSIIVREGANGNGWL